MTIRAGTSAAVLISLVLLAAPAAAQSSACPGDCDMDGNLTVSELITAVDISFGNQPVAVCASADLDSSGDVDVSELVQLVRRALSGCPKEQGAVFLIRVCASSEKPGGETFRALLRDPAVIAEAEGLIGAGQAMILNGPIVAGDGGFNAPWSWHLDPAESSFAEFTIEVCDGCPRFIEEDLDYWLNVVGRYCPWSTEVVARER